MNTDWQHLASADCEKLRPKRQRMLRPVALAATLLLTALLMSCDARQPPEARKAPEEACLQSDALNFKDPTSLKVIANLGDRKQGWTADEQSKKFWIRYIAKNSYGANISSNMACSNVGDIGWVRDRGLEKAAILDMQTLRLTLLVEQALSRNKKLEACGKRRDCLEQVRSEFPDTPADGEAWITTRRQAEVAVLESPGDLGALVPKKLEPTAR